MKHSEHTGTFNKLPQKSWVGWKMSHTIVRWHRPPPTKIKKKQDGAHEPECKHIRQTTAYKKRHSRSESLFHSLARCWTSCAGDSTTKAACAGDFTTKLRLHHEGSLFCIQIKHWRKGSGRSAARKKQWHCPKISKIST